MTQLLASLALAAIVPAVLALLVHGITAEEEPVYVARVANVLEVIVSKLVKAEEV